MRYDLNYVKYKQNKDEIEKFIKNYKREEPLQVLEINNRTILPQKEADPQISPNAWGGGG